MSDGILLAGAGRGTGLEIARLLRARGDKVTALVRPGSDAGELERLGVTVVRGNILDRAGVEAAFAAGPFKAVIDTVGGKRGEPRPDYEGTVLLVDETLAAGVRRFLFVTAIGCGASRAAVGPRVIEFLGRYWTRRRRVRTT